jgi:prevent-host-death family protein
MVFADSLIDGPERSDHNSGELPLNGSTMQVLIRELKAHLSQYLGRAQAGQSLEITSHRKVVARIVGVPAPSDQGLVRLVAGGAATWAGGKPAGASFRLSAKGTPVSQMVMEDCG